MTLEAPDGIAFRTTLDGVTSDHLNGFFAGWPNPPTPETFLAILRGSSNVVLAVETESGRVVGFINAISDGVLAAYLPLLEVLPEFQGRGIGTSLVERMLEQLRDLYMIDLACDAELVPFYERFGMFTGTAMLRRNYATQSGGASSLNRAGGDNDV